MNELQGQAAKIKGFKFPERTRLTEGLSRAGVPYSLDAKEFAGQRLSGRDIEALFFGRRLHGRQLESGEEHGGSISADGGNVVMFGGWSNGAGSARIDGDRLCFAWSAATFCASVFHNPGGTRAKENEFIMFFEGWGYPFSPVE
jgi:hypothetical protein